MNELESKYEHDMLPGSNHTPLTLMMDRISCVFALAGGAIMLLLINMSLVSIVGRKLMSTPIQGDMELIEVGSAIAIAAFLPIAEIRGINIKADAFTLWASQKTKITLDTIGHFMLFSLSLLLTWRTWLKLLDYYEYEDVSTLLSIPMWMPLALIIPSLLLLSLCALTQVITLIKQRGSL